MAKKNQSLSTIPKHLCTEAIQAISEIKNEPKWMLELRLKALKHFEQTPLPAWGPDLSQLKISDIRPYVATSDKPSRSWESVSPEVKSTFEKLGVQKAEKEHLGGLGAQYESEIVYHRLKDELEKQGVIFLSMEDGLKKHPDLFKKYFGSIVPFTDNKFAALNTAAWSGGSFVYIPKNTKVTIPLQTYYRIASEKMGQFERTLIIADENSHVNYVEGCTAPAFSKNSLHGAVVEIIALKGSRVRYTTIQNWGKNIYNLVTKRAVAYQNALIEWVDGNFGSKITMKYPCVLLKETGARAEITSIASAGANNQIQDSGAKMIHLAPRTTSRVISKSISANGGRCSYRGLVKIVEGATECKSSVICDALILDEKSHSDTFPLMDIQENAQVGHEARVSRVEDEQLFYLASRGISSTEAQSMIINGFVEPFTKQLPMEYAVEMNRLLELELKGTIG